MDPLSITAACSSLAFAIARNGRSLAILYDKFHNARNSIFMIQTECAVLAAALSHLEISISAQRPSRSARWPVSVVEALNQSLTGCSVTLIALEQQIEQMTNGADIKTSIFGRRKRVQYVWKEESMIDLLQQLRGQSIALSLLLKAFDSTSVDQILDIVRSGQTTFQRVRDGAASIRSANPERSYPENIIDVPFDDRMTIYSLQMPGQSGDGTNAREAATAAIQEDLSDSEPSEDVELPTGWEKFHSKINDQWFYVHTRQQKVSWKVPAASQSSQISSATSEGLPSRAKPDNSGNAQRPSQITEPQASPAKVEPKATNGEMTQQVNLKPWVISTWAKLEARLESLRQTDSIPAFAVGIVPANGSPELIIKGNRRKGHTATVTRSDRFGFGNSALITTTILSTLIRQGFLTWEDKIIDLIPSLTASAHPFHNQTTLSMLAGHRSGITAAVKEIEKGDVWRYIRQSDVSGKEGRMAIATCYLQRSPDTDPGTNYLWNPVNHLLIACALEEKMGKPFELLVKTGVFDPLEMYSAGFGWSDNMRNQKSAPTQPWPHCDEPVSVLDYDRASEFNIQSLWPTGGLSVSMPDFASYVKMQLHRCMGLQEGEFRSSDATEKYRQSLLAEKDDWIRKGWTVNETYKTLDEPVVYNNNATLGSNTLMMLAPGIGTAYFAVTNAESLLPMPKILPLLETVISYDRQKQGK